ncbi:MAG: preprotein translocase subunit YajC [Thermodesulfovibrionales bacterium]|nr:preprotein translocase subunit YajC [Thermodesulfovibrionales bacterium]
MFSDIAWAMGGAPQGGQGGGGGLASFLPLILIFVIFYFLLIRPQQKKAKEHRQMLEAVKKGDKVVTSGGLYGLVESVSENTLMLKVAENVKVKLGKAYIAAVRSSTEED